MDSGALSDRRVGPASGPLPVLCSCIGYLNCARTFLARTTSSRISRNASPSEDDPTRLPARVEALTSWCRSKISSWVRGAAVASFVPSPRLAGRAGSTRCQRTLVAIPPAAGLRHCAFDTDNDGAHYVACDGAGVADGDLTVPFISISVAAAICAVWWLYLQYRDSWMVPAWDSALWWTPTHACGIAAFVACPVVLVFTYFAHSSPGYVIGPSGWAAAGPHCASCSRRAPGCDHHGGFRGAAAVGRRFPCRHRAARLSHLGHGGDLGTHSLRGRRDRDRLARPGSRREREDAGLSPSRLRPNAVPGAGMGGLR